MKDEDVLVLDLRKVSSVTDFFVICGSKSVIGVKAIAEEIFHRLKEEGIHADHVEGLADGAWILADYGDVVVHVFLKQVRQYYDLESFWGDAPRKDYKIKARKGASKRGSKK